MQAFRRARGLLSRVTENNGYPTLWYQLLGAESRGGRAFANRSKGPDVLVSQPIARWPPIHSKARFAPFSVNRRQRLSALTCYWYAVTLADVRLLTSRKLLCQVVTSPLNLQQRANTRGRQPGFLMPATFVCCSSAGIFLYAMSKERELERAWHQKQLDRLRGWYAEPTAPLWLPRFLKRWWLQLQDDWEQLSTCQRVNMYALHWLVAAPCAVMAAPQTGALYMSAGLFSSLASHLGGLLGVRGTVSSSVGASGAIYGCAAATAVLYPDLQAGIIFIPGFHMPLSSLFPLLLGVDVLGVLLRWRLFDHWGHLGGALFGYMYTKYGQTIIWEQRDRIMAALGK